ncbi:MAG: polyphosphate kinase 1 [Bacteroidetes bacterium]|nr:polyphosphate kinase 1 [Bacteroidota bacterium]
MSPARKNTRPKGKPVRAKSDERICHTVPRDISWLSFNARVLQEAADPSVSLRDRIRFLGIFSNNLDEFFRVRVAALGRMVRYGSRANMHLERSPRQILESIHHIVIEQQEAFNRIWEGIQSDLKKERIHLLTERQLDKKQREHVDRYFVEQVRQNVIPLLIENIPRLPYLREKSLYLAVVMTRRDGSVPMRYALIEVPTRVLPRFLEIPPKRSGERHLILLEDVIRHSLPRIFSFLGHDIFSAHVVKVTKDAEFDLDVDETMSYIDRIEKGIKDRRKGRAVRFVYDREIDPGLLTYLINRIGLRPKDPLIPGGRIHNFRHFIDFPNEVFRRSAQRLAPLLHPDFRGRGRVTDVILRKDVMLHLPYHSFDPIIDLLREAAMDQDVTSIHLTAYRLAPKSRIVNALINAVRNGKLVTVVLELRARFDEENNLEWKKILEEEGVRVYVGVPGLKVHAKVCLIRKKIKRGWLTYGFVGTGNLHEGTARIYVDHFLLTSRESVMKDLSRIFRALEKPEQRLQELADCRHLLCSPLRMRKVLLHAIRKEALAARKGKPAAITLKLNSLSDEVLMKSLEQAAAAGVQIRMIIRGICCLVPQQIRGGECIQSVSIVDTFLEHARVMVFHNGGEPRVWISSADWMVRNLDHRIEVAIPIEDPAIAVELTEILEIQLSDNVKARRIEGGLQNDYVRSTGKKVQSQIEICRYLEKGRR